MTTTTVADGNDTRRISSRRAAGSTRRKPSTGERKWRCRTGQSRRASAVFRYAAVSPRALVSSRYRRLLYGVGLLELCRIWICLVRSASRRLSCCLMTSRSAKHRDHTSLLPVSRFAAACGNDAHDTRQVYPHFGGKIVHIPEPVSVFAAFVLEEVQTVFGAISRVGTL